MHAPLLLSLLLLAAEPFWQTKPVAEWTPQELTKMLTDSPWAHLAEPVREGPQGTPVPVFLATARPMRLAEAEARRRFRKRAPGSEESFSESEYRAFLEQDGGKSIVVAVRLRERTGLMEAGEMKRMEQECRLRIGRRKYGLKMHFPPSANDPYLRLVFPRDVQPDDKRIDLELYLPGVPSPYREAWFTLKDMMFDGKPEF